jgi:hypothetical protein
MTPSEIHERARRLREKLKGVDVGPTFVSWFELYARPNSPAWDRWAENFEKLIDEALSWIGREGH